MKDEGAGSVLILFLLSVSHLYFRTESGVDGSVASAICHLAPSNIARRFICGPDCSILAIMEL